MIVKTISLIRLIRQIFVIFVSTDRAIYVNKFEEVDAPEITFNISNTEDIMNLDSVCLCESKNLSLLCNDTKLLNILSSMNFGTLIVKKLVALDDDVFIVLISSDFVAIYSYDDTKEQLLQKAGEFYEKKIFAVVL